MGDNILDASELGDSKKQETTEVTESIEKADGFAQVFPEHKFHIVDVLQKLGHMVGMTGDGVNDAPALKKADCGIAVSSATDVARAASALVLMMPGLSVIIDAIKESRKIFQKMNSYVIYRISETIRVLFFMTLAILVFNFYPLTAVMIVMLALLNDGAILSIAYDNVHYKNQPEAWNMRMVLGIATVLGVIGVISAFGLFYLAERVFHLDREHIQTLMYLKLSVAGHLTIFLTRTRGPFWSIRPAKILWGAVLGTQIVATLIAVYGFFMMPLGWGWAGFVWGYALVWFFINDRVKLLAYRIFDPVRVAAKPEAKEESKTVSNIEFKPETKVEVKAKPAFEAKAEVKKLDSEYGVKTGAKIETKSKVASDLKSQIAARAYEIYEQKDRRDGQSIQNWEEAEREIREDQAKSMLQEKEEFKSEIKSESKTQINQDLEIKVKTPSDLTPQLIERVHKFYEELGRQDVRAVQEFDEAERKLSENETKK